uniref:Uncharacterized protein n=1 Tax=Rhizophora mucronata TaxID=61149 RepID=A0A2P2NNU9_RHIMU
MCYATLCPIQIHKLLVSEAGRCYKSGLDLFFYFTRLVLHH